MHGLIFSEMKRFATARLGTDGWQRLLGAAKLSDRVYIVSEAYPDTEATALIKALATLTKKLESDVQEDFGRFVAPTLVGMYSRLIQPTWKSLDLIENAENTMHTVVRLRNKGATPPVLTATRLGPNELRVDYGSHRKMCHLAVGIIQGLGEHYHETLRVQQTKCMHNGDPQCEIEVKRV